MFCDLCYSLKCSFTLQFHLYLTLDNVIEFMSTQHSNSNNRGNSKVELMGGGW